MIDATPLFRVSATIRLNDMVASTACPNCDSSSVRYSHRRLKDGLLRVLFFSAFRCHACGHRHYRFNFLGVALAVAVLLVIALFVGVVHLMSRYYEQPAAPQFLSRQEVTGRSLGGARPGGGFSVPVTRAASGAADLTA